MPLTYVLVKGAPLTKAEFDGNISILDGRLVTLEDDLPTPVGIDEVQQIGDSFQFIFTDSTVSSLIQLPAVNIRGMGAWQALTSYLRNDIVSANGNAYLVLENHTSEASFDAGAGDSDGDYYALLIPAPELSLPPGGGDGFVLTKASSSDFDFQWMNSGVPAGGIAGDVLVKASADEYDTEWSAVGVSVVEEVTANTFNPTLSDANAYFRCTHASGCVVQMPENASVAFPIGTELVFRQSSSGPVILLGENSDSIITLNAKIGYEPITGVEGGVMYTKKIAANAWDVWGDLLAESFSDTA